MIGLLQRVSEASVTVDGAVVGAIGPGLLVLVGVQRGDGEAQVERLLERLITYRVFPDDGGRMDLSLQDTGGSLLLVSQFTLAADTRKGRRASFTPAAAPEVGERCFGRLVERARATLGEDRVATGRFGAHMAVASVNDGPVTLWLEAPPEQPL